MEEKIVYFEQPGEANTGEVLRLVKERANARQIDKVILASTRGNTARLALEAFTDTKIKLVVIPWQFGFADTQPFPMELVAEMRAKGHEVHFGTMLWHTENLYGSKTPEIMANLLRTFCQGVKVSVEITLMATDGGLVDAKEKVIAIAGTGSGADTAVVVTAAPSTKWAKLHVSEIICKPL